MSSCPLSGLRKILDAVTATVVPTPLHIETLMRGNPHWQLELDRRYACLTPDQRAAAVARFAEHFTVYPDGLNCRIRGAESPGFIAYALVMDLIVAELGHTLPPRCSPLPDSSHLSRDVPAYFPLDMKPLEPGAPVPHPPMGAMELPAYIELTDEAGMLRLCAGTLVGFSLWVPYPCKGTRVLGPGEHPDGSRYYFRGLAPEGAWWSPYSQCAGTCGEASFGRAFKDVYGVELLPSVP